MDGQKGETEMNLKQTGRLAVLVLFALLLCACGARGEAPAGGGRAATVESGAAEDGDERQFTALQGANGIAYGGTGEDGFYFVNLETRADGSSNLMYLDYASMRTAYLCARPGCAHDSADCACYVPASAGGAVPCVVGKNLLLVFPGKLYSEGNTAVLPHIERMDLDGSYRQTVVTFEADQMLCLPFVTDGSALYARLETARAEGQAQAELVRIDLADGGVTSLCPLAQEWLRGGAGRNLILLDADGSYFAYDPATGARTLIVRAEDASLTTALFGTTLVCQEDGCFCLYDLLTGERTALGGYTIPGVEAAFSTAIDADAGRLLFRVESTESQTGGELADGYYVLTGGEAPQPWTLVWESGGEQTPYIRVATLPDGRYLVITGERAPEAAGEADGELDGAAPATYTLMRPEDYWTSRDTPA